VSRSASWRMKRRTAKNPSGSKKYHQPYDGKKNIHHFTKIVKSYFGSRLCLPAFGGSKVEDPEFNQMDQEDQELF